MAIDSKKWSDFGPRRRLEFPARLLVLAFNSDWTFAGNTATDLLQIFPEYSWIMDVILGLADEYLLDRVWARLVPGTHALLRLSPQSHALPINASIIPPLAKWSILQPPAIASAWPRDHIFRQLLSLTVITLIGIFVLYFLFASLSFYFIFNHDMMRHPRFLPNQVKLEIICSLWAFPGMTLLTLPFFLSEVRGHTRLYDKVEDYGWPYLIASVPM